MQMTMRWFGPADSVPLWTLRQTIEAAGLTLSVIESIPIHDDIKLGNARRDGRISAWVQSLEAVAAEGVPVVCSTFMPVFDWTPPTSRTSAPTAALPWSTGTPTRRATRGTARPPCPAGLRRARRKCWPPCASPTRISLRPVLGLPLSTTGDLEFVLRAAPDEHSGLTFYTGSLGARPGNDLPALARRFAPHIHFVHAWNVRCHGERDFDEVPHVSDHGSTELARTVMILARQCPDVPIRPDHGRMIWGATGRPSYPLHDRALGATHLQGLIDAAHLED